MRVLTCIGDAMSIDAHGGLPFYFLDAGRRSGFLDAGWRLEPKRLRHARAFWNIGQLLTRRELGGYQYSENFLRALLRQVPPAWSEPDEIISIFPLFPPKGVRHARVTIYIDATLKENFEDYGIGRHVGRSMMVEALERERQAYRDAVRIICRSRMAAKVVVESYGIDPRKVHIVPGGANVSDGCVPSFEYSRRPMVPVRLGFIGKDWRRKNLPFVLAVSDSLGKRGIAAEVIAAGFDPKRGPRHPHLRACGFIDKRRDLQRFADILASCHFTCLFSHAEAFGLSNRESLRFGVPVLAAMVGGIPDTVPDGCGHLFAKDATPAEVADFVASYVRQPDAYHALRRSIERRRAEFTWAAAIEKMQTIWSGSHQYRYDVIAQTHG